MHASAVKSPRLVMLRILGVRCGRAAVRSGQTGPQSHLDSHLVRGMALLRREILYSSGRRRNIAEVCRVGPAHPSLMPSASGIPVVSNPALADCYDDWAFLQGWNLENSASPSARGTLQPRAFCYLSQHLQFVLVASSALAWWPTTRCFLCPL